MPVTPYIYIENNTKAEVLAPETNYQNKNNAYKEDETANMIQ
jgi:hypothetical protein